MVTDAMLQTAAAEVSQCILDNLPDAAFCGHKFSKKFENKMRRLIRRADHPVRYQVFRGVVAAVLAAIILFGGVLALSPEVRAEVIRWIKEQIGTATHYQSDETGPADGNYKYVITNLSDSYIFLTEIDTGNGMTYVYTTSDGRMLYFSYLFSGDIYLEAENANYQSTLVNGIFAEAYLAKDINENNSLVWKNDTEEVLFHIDAPCSLEELISMAESVKKITN